MVTINLALTVPLNPPGSHPIITPTQAWSALVRKARQPQDFVPVVSSCTILSETPQSISAEVYFHPGVGHARVIRETCTFHPPCRLDYDMEDGVEEGSEEAMELEKIHREVAKRAMDNMVVTVRKMVADGEL